jgi:ATP-dependent DNA helicase DinG
MPDPISISTLDPCDLGLPEKFASFRPEQVEAVDAILNTPKRFYGAALPTGAGKTLIAAAAARASGLRTVILTGTKGLQDQYLRDFTESGLIDIRGTSNYTCKAMNVNCRMGQSAGCPLCTGGGCTYKQRLQEARGADLVITNYDYWVAVNKFGNGLDKPPEFEGDEPKPVEMLIMDESHGAFERLGGALKVSIKESVLIAADLDYAKTDDLKTWVSWALTVPIALKGSYQQTMLKYKLTKNPSLLHRLYAMEELSSTVEEIGRMALDGWVCEMRVGTNYGRTWDFDPVWPGAYSESRLFCGVKKIVLMSATLRPASLAMLGINMREAEFKEWPRVFPANRTPVYAVPTIRMNHRNTEEDLTKWVSRIDEIIGSRLDRKGIIHTVSYQRQKYILEHSRYAANMLANTGAPDSDSALEIMAKFKASSAPSILVSPSFSTGVDFPGRACEWQIICKVPFADLRSKVMAARNERNKVYVNYLAMQEIVQSCGRASRHKFDRSENFIIDSNMLWFLQQNKGLAPRWFEVIRTERVPPPGPRAPEFGSVEIKLN